MSPGRLPVRGFFLHSAQHASGAVPACCPL